jgi:hypothetical protein
VLDSVIGCIISRLSELQNYINRILDDKWGIISVHVRTVRQKRQSTSWCMIFENISEKRRKILCFAWKTLTKIKFIAQLIGST